MHKQRASGGVMRSVVRVALACVLSAAAGHAVHARLSPAAVPSPTPLPRNLDVMIGQMLVIGFTGTRPADNGVDAAARALAQGLIGGVILMDRNIVSPPQLRTLTALFQAASQRHLPLIAVDQEGGAVQRLSSGKGFHRYPSARRLARRHTPTSAYHVYRAMACELAAAGINLNLGPVVDLDLNIHNTVIGRRGRSFGPDPERVTAFARAFIAAHREFGVLTSVKHFPGHGSSAVDSHRRLVDLTHYWSERELMPYRRLADERRIDTIMVGHLYLPTFARQPVPATLAPKAIDWLRSDLGYHGVVITDDLGMGAIRQRLDIYEGLVQALAAGNDLLLVAQTGGYADFPARAVASIRAAVAEGRIPVRRIEQSYRRIVALKAALRERSKAIALTDTAP